jgi:hypothetical protein
MDASASDVRAWARANGIEVNDKGAISGAVSEAYRAAHNGDTMHAPGVPDYPPGMDDSDFDLAEAELPDDVDDTAEVAPRRVASPKRGTSGTTLPKLSDRFRRGKSAARPKGRAKPKRPRTSTAEMIGSAWRIAAKVAQPLPPMYRTLRLQSVIAGPLLDDAVKGTMVDPILQPLARMSQAGQTVSALVAPNLAIGAMAYHLHQTSGEPNPVVMQACQEMLRYGLMAMMRVGGEAFAVQLAKDKADEEQFGTSVDELMAMILADMADPATEEANIAAMAARFAGQPDPGPAVA